MSTSQTLASSLLRQLIAIAIIPIVITAIFFIWQLLPQIEQNISRNQQALANSIAEQTIQHIRASQEQISVLTQLSSEMSGDSNLINKGFSSVTAMSPYFDALYEVDQFGIISHINMQTENTEGIQELYIGMDISMSPLFQRPGALDQPFWSGAFLSVVTGRMSIAYVVPLKHSILVAELTLGRLPKLSQSLSEENRIVMILDHRAQLIAHPNEELSQQQINLNNLSFFENRFHGQRLRSADFTWQDQLYFGTAISIESPQWYIIVAEDKSSVFAPLYAVIQYWMASIFLIVLVATLLAYRRSRSFSKRFTLLNNQAKNITQGQYNTPMAETSILELDDLAQNMNKMAAAIQKRESSLQTQELQLRNTLEGAPSVAVQWYDDKGHVCYWNDASEKIFGYTAEEALGKRLDKLIFTPQPTAEFNLRLRRIQQSDHDSQEFELPFHHKNGHEGYVLGTLFSIPSQDNKEVYVCMAIDMTRQRQAEANIRKLNAELEEHVEERTLDLKHANDELNFTLKTLENTIDQLVQSEKLAALGGLVAGIAHELNTPIGNALMAASSLRDFTEEIQQAFNSGSMTKSGFNKFLNDANEASDITKRNLDRASELVSSFKQVAVDQSSSHKRQFKLSELVQELLTTLQPVLKHSPAKVSIDIPDNIDMKSYPGPLGQVINNIINNSITHGFDNLDKGTISLTAKLGDDSVCLTIRDDGNGIPAENINKIFDPFYTTKLGQGGSGLGMHIVHNIVTEVLGGSVELTSEPGKGTEISLTLPLEGPESDVNQVA